MIEKFVWTEKYSVGVKMIDEQHKEFFGIANDLIDLAAGNSFSREEAAAHLGRLGDYALYHLGTEEEYFSKFHYPEAPIHVASHNMFRNEIVGLMNEARAEDTDLGKLSEKAAEFAIKWLSEHILVIDKKYTECFHQHGLY